MQKQVKFRGTPVYMAGRWWVVPPISVRQAQEYEGLLKEGPLTDIESALWLIERALSRNYPEITREFLLDNLDGATAKESVDALSALSGLTEVEPGENRPVAPTGGQSTD